MTWPARFTWVAVVVVSAVLAATFAVRSIDQHGVLTASTRAGGPLFGASASSRGWLARSTAEFGHLPIIRTSYTGLPATNVWTTGADGFNKSAVVVSFGARPSRVLSGADDAALRHFFNTAPTRHKIYYSYYREPEAHVLAHQFTAAQYKAAWAHIVMLANKAHNPDLKATLILRARDLKPHSGLNWKDYLPGGRIISTLAWDAYPAGTWSNDHPQLTPPPEFMGPAVAASKSVGLPFGFAAFARVTANGRPRWLKEVANYLMSSGALFGLLFNSPRYPTMEVTDSASIAAWRSVVARSGTDDPLPLGPEPPTPTPTPNPTTPTPRPPTPTPTPTSGGGPTTGCSPGTPVTITTGGTYSGCYQSTDVNTPAVTVDTGSAVTLSHATILSKGNGVVAGASPRPNLTITDSTFTALDPGRPAHQMCVYADAPASLTIEHNQFTDCQGILVNGEGLTTSPFSASYNNYTDIGRYGQTDWFAGAVHTEGVNAPGATLDWNRITSRYGISVSEDVFGLVDTNGAPGSPVDVGHNLVNGDYPASGDGSSFSGVAFDLSDVGGSYQNAHDNTAVNYAGSGFAAGTGSHIHFTNDTAVSDGLADNGARVNATFGDGFSTWHNSSYPASGPNLHVANSTSGHLRWTGSSRERADFYLPYCDPSTACTGNTTLGTVNGAGEQAAITAYETSVTAAGVTIGPRP